MAAGFSFFVPGDVVPWGRAGGGKTVARFTPPKQRSYAAVLKALCLEAMAGAKPYDEPLRLELQAAYPWPKTWPAKKRADPRAKWRCSRPDFDNISKIVGDALNRVAWEDDAQIVVAHISKIYSDHPGLSVCVEVLT